MKDRIKQIRKSENLTQVEFAERLGISASNVISYENGLRSPSASGIQNICRTFGINEQWLLTGEGEMKSESKEEELARLTAQMFREEDESFRLKLVRMVANMSDEQIEMCQKMVDSLK